MIKAILFDFNGVIIDDEPLQMQAYTDVLAQEDIVLSEDDYYSSLGMDDVRFVEAAFKRADRELEPEVLQRVIERKAAAHQELIADEIPFFPGVVNFVKQARHHFKLGIVSMARREEIEAVLSRAGISDAFEVIVSAEDVANCKPNPECYNKGFGKIDAINTTEGKFPLTREQVLVIEDAPPGVAAARAAGLQVLGVANTVAPDKLRAAGANSVTKNLADWTPKTVELVFR